MAMNTHRQLGIANTGSSKSMEKLSSGYRINRAGDDAAGLSISEKMRGQIRGLTQASRNAQDGISLIQTAEGALNETHSILQRMRELAVQASTDTNTLDDRREIQKELDQLTAEIDRIGNTTEFNTMKLVNGEQSQKAKLDTANVTGLVGAKAVDALKPGDYTVDVVNTALVGAKVNDTDTNTSAIGLGNVGTDYKVGDKFEIVITDGSTPGTNHNVSLRNSEGQVVGTLTDVATANLQNALEFNTGNAATQINITLTGANANGTVGFTYGVRADYTVKNEAGETKTRTGVVSDNGKVDIAGLQLNVDGALANGQSTVTVSGESLQLQVGANENQSIRLSIGDMRAEALEINNIDVSDHKNAKAAITTIQTAIETVSSERSKLGAMQNRLEHTIKNLDTSSENLQASEARIRDVDMAKEMMEQTKNNILQQAATAMLAQANSAPQGVLQLLR